MTPDYARGVACGYAWGQEDATGIKTASPIPGPCPPMGWYLFARTYTRMQEDHARERRGMAMAVQGAYARWQETGGATIEEAGGTEEHLLAAARAWVTREFAGSPHAGLVNPDEMTDHEVRTGMDRHYDGGWPAFRRAELAARYRTTATETR